MIESIFDQCVRKLPELCVIISTRIILDLLNFSEKSKILFHFGVIVWTIGWLTGIIIINKCKMVK